MGPQLASVPLLCRNRLNRETGGNPVMVGGGGEHLLLPGQAGGISLEVKGGNHITLVIVDTKRVPKRSNRPCDNFSYSYSWL